MRFWFVFCQFNICCDSAHQMPLPGSKGKQCHPLGRYQRWYGHLLRPTEVVEGCFVCRNVVSDFFDCPPSRQHFTPPVVCPFGALIRLSTRFRLFFSSNGGKDWFTLFLMKILAYNIIFKIVWWLVLRDGGILIHGYTKCFLSNFWG